MTFAMGASQSHERDASVPFPRFCALVGYYVICLLIIAGVVNLVAWSWLQLRARNEAVAVRRSFGELRCRGTADPNCLPRESIDIASASPVFDNEPWAEDMWREYRAAFGKGSPLAPFLAWENSELHGRFLNVDPSPLGFLRRTVAPPAACHGKRVELWMLGGSAMFGFGVPDDATVASALAKRLRAQDPCIEVVNLGVAGYDSNQELVQLVFLLKQGHHPDVVIAYHGYNDMWVSALDNQPKAYMRFNEFAANHSLVVTPLTWLKRSSTADLARIWLRRPAAASPPSPAEWQRRARVTLDNFEQNCSVMQALAKQYDFRFYNLWQPSLFHGAKPVTSFEANVIREHEAGNLQALGQAARVVYAEAELRSRAGAKFTLLSAIFDQEPGAIYMDHVHLGPRGNDLAAEAIARALAQDQALHPPR